jgi:hypothetical protein
MTWQATSSPLLHIFFFFFFSANNSNPPFYHKSNSHHHKSGHPNIQFVSIPILIQFFLGFPTSSKQNYLFFLF